MFDMRTPCDTTDDKPVIKLWPKFVKSVLVNSCDNVGSPFFDPFLDLRCDLWSFI